MAAIAIPQYGSVIQSDSANTPNAIVQRDSSGNVVVSQLQASEVKGTTYTATVVNKTTSFTADATASIFTCNATGGAIVATLPAVATVTGRAYTFKKTDAAANNVTVTGSGAETIDGANTKVLSAQFSRVSIVSDGTTWQILA